MLSHIGQQTILIIFSWIPLILLGTCRSQELYKSSTLKVIFVFSQSLKGKPAFIEMFNKLSKLS